MFISLVNSNWTAGSVKSLVSEYLFIILFSIYVYSVSDIGLAKDGSILGYFFLKSFTLSLFMFIQSFLATSCVKLLAGIFVFSPVLGLV